MGVCIRCVVRARSKGWMKFHACSFVDHFGSRVVQLLSVISACKHYSNWDGSFLLCFVGVMFTFRERCTKYPFILFGAKIQMFGCFPWLDMINNIDR